MQELVELLQAFPDGLTTPEVREKYGASDIAITSKLLKQLGARRTGEYKYQKTIKKEFGIREVKDEKTGLITKKPGLFDKIKLTRLNIWRVG